MRVKVIIIIRLVGRWRRTRVRTATGSKGFIYYCRSFHNTLRVIRFNSNPLTHTSFMLYNIMLSQLSFHWLHRQRIKKHKKKIKQHKIRADYGVILSAVIRDFRTQLQVISGNRQGFETRACEHKSGFKRVIATKQFSVGARQQVEHTESGRMSMILHQNIVPYLTSSSSFFFIFRKLGIGVSAHLATMRFCYLAVY